MITEKIREVLTPIQMKQNMENKELKQILDEMSSFIYSKVGLIDETSKAYTDLKNAALFQLRNNDKESEAFTRELSRM